MEPMDSEWMRAAVVMRVWIEEPGGWYQILVEQHLPKGYSGVVYASHPAAQQLRAVGIRVDYRVDAWYAVIDALGRLRLSLQGPIDR